MPVRGRIVLEGIRHAASVASDPSVALTLWKTVTGGKIVGCVPATPVPELLHAVRLLPIPPASPEDLSLLSGRIDAWLTGEGGSPLFPASGRIARFAFPPVTPGNVEEALDRVESLAEWASSISGFPASEGALWKSIRAYATLQTLLDALDVRCSRETAFLTPEERRDIARAGAFLPPEAHSRLLSTILGTDPAPASIHPEGERGDPLILLARRLV